MLIDPDQKKVLLTWDNEASKEAIGGVKISESPLIKTEASMARIAKQVDLATLSIQGVSLGISTETAKSALKKGGYIAHETRNKYRKSCVAIKIDKSGRRILTVDWPVSAPRQTMPTKSSTPIVSIRALPSIEGTCASRFRASMARPISKMAGQ